MMATDFRIESFDFKVYGICKVAQIVRNSTKRFPSEIRICKSFRLSQLEMLKYLDADSAKS